MRSTPCVGLMSLRLGFTGIRLPLIGFPELKCLRVHGGGDLGAALASVEKQSPCNNDDSDHTKYMQR